MCAGKGSTNTGIGAYSLMAACNASTLMFNTALGYNSGKCLTSGLKNVILGSASGCCITTGCNNVLIGHNVDGPVINGSNQLVIGSNTETGSPHGTAYDRDWETTTRSGS